MFGTIRKLMSNVMPTRPAPRPPPVQPTGWSDRSGFTPSIRSSGRPDFNPALAPPTASSRPRNVQPAESAKATEEVSERSFEEIVKLTADWLKEKAYTAAEVLAVLSREAPDSERSKQISHDLGVFQSQHNISDAVMTRSLDFLNAPDFRRHTNDGDPVHPR